MIAGLHARHAFADFHHHAAAFMAEHRREQAFGIVAAQRERIGVAHAGMRDAHEHFARARRCDVDLDDAKRLTGGESDGGAGLHRRGLRWGSPRYTGRKPPRHAYGSVRLQEARWPTLPAPESRMDRVQKLRCSLASPSIA